MTDDERPPFIARAFDALAATEPLALGRDVRRPARQPTARDAAERLTCQRCGRSISAVSVMLTVTCDAPPAPRRFDALLCQECAAFMLRTIGDALDSGGTLG